jgi:formylglycine-generating enzyme required for sulfatase activity
MSTSNDTGHGAAAVGSAICLLVSAGPALGEVPGQYLGGPSTFEYGTEFVTVGDPGNRDTVDSDFGPSIGFPRTYGGVDYAYRLARTEVTIGQHAEFVAAYAPYYIADNPVGFSASRRFTGDGMFMFYNAPSGAFEIELRDSADTPTTIGFAYAARLVNWLHNDKATDRASFETGVYDLSTFVVDENRIAQHDVTRPADARFWIPSQDEWVKAAYWDPRKDGNAGGYWQYPNTSDGESRPGLPADGGERNAGDDDFGFPLPVGSYPDVQSPWGVLDMAGGQEEWTSTVLRRIVDGSVAEHGTSFRVDSFGDVFGPNDLIGYSRSSSLLNGLNGLRLATQIPSPTVVQFVLLGGLFMYQRKRW